MRYIKRVICIALLAVVGFGVPKSLDATVVRFNSNLGSFDVDLFENDTPQTVANFLFYLNSGAYTDSIVHRSVPGFVVQGGGFYSDFSAVPTQPPIGDELMFSNTRGTIALAENSLGGTSQWFVNLNDNVGLDSEFTVFGEVLGDGLTVIDQIAALQIVDIGAPFNELPILDTALPPTVDPDELVVFSSVVVVPEPSCLTLFLASGVLLIGRRRRV